jgi:hypothetical protein
MVSPTRKPRLSATCLEISTAGTGLASAELLRVPPQVATKVRIKSRWLCVRVIPQCMRDQHVARHPFATAQLPSALVAKAPLPLRDSSGWHSQIQTLLDADDVREQKQRASAYPSSWEAPIFRSVFEKRRLRILNALFTCLTRSGMTARVSDVGRA